MLLALTASSKNMALRISKSLSTTKTIVIYANLEIWAFTPWQCVSDVHQVRTWNGPLCILCRGFSFLLMHNSLCVWKPAGKIEKKNSRKDFVSLKVKRWLLIWLCWFQRNFALLFEKQTWRWVFPKVSVFLQIHEVLGAVQILCNPLENKEGGWGVNDCLE